MEDILLWGLTTVIALLVVNVSYTLGRSHQVQICTEAHLEIVRQMTLEADELEREVQRLEAALDGMESKHTGV